MTPHWRKSSGQALLIASLLFIVLLMVVPVMVFVTRTVTQQDVQMQKKLKSRSIAQEGLAFAVSQLVNTWPYQGGPGVPGLPAQLPVLASGQGTYYSVSYTSWSALGPHPMLQSYQVGVLTRAVTAAGVSLPGGALFAQVSRHTVGVKLPNGMGTAAALWLGAAPTLTPTSNLWIYFGPMVVADDVLVTLDLNSDTTRRPRKFTAGPVTGTTYTRAPNAAAPRTDNKEYWAYQSIPLPPVINMTSYITAAKFQSVCAPAACTGTCTAGATIAADPVNSCYFFVPPADRAVFDDPLSPSPPGGYSLKPGNVLYVDGHATFQRVTMNVASTGAIIVTGNLRLADNRDNAGGPYSFPMSCPPTRCLDLPYDICSGIGCTSNRFLDIKGFVYVQGLLNYHPTAGAGAWWAIDGVVRVDGQLIMDTNKNLQITYDDLTNHNILTTNYQVHVDSMTWLAL